MVTFTPKEFLSLWFTRLAALAVWGTLALQLIASIQSARASGHVAGWGLVMYFGYFTILTNLIAGLTLTAWLAKPSSKAGRFLANPTTATAVATAILLVSLAYHFILRETWHPEGLKPAAGAMLHYVNPALYLVFWAWLVPKKSVHWLEIPKWCLYPMVYSLYAFVRGEIIGVYPYPFIDVNTLGHQQAIMNATVLLVAYLVISIVLVTITRLPALARQGN